MQEVHINARLRDQQSVRLRLEGAPPGRRTPCAVVRLYDISTAKPRRSTRVQMHPQVLCAVTSSVVV